MQKAHKVNVKRVSAILLSLVLAVTYIPYSPATQILPGLQADTVTAADPIPIYQDITKYTFEERAADLISRMTTAEKGSQLTGSNSAAIPRLGIAGYQWWNEAIHGLSRNGGVGGPPQTIDSTSYPVSYSVGSTWDKDLYYREAIEIGEEIRETTADHKYQLTYYSPTVNLSRDPRWGRNDESYSEDPFLTGEMATQFIAGVEGKNQDGTYKKDNGRGEGYLNAVTTIKHYTANNSEDNRRDDGAETDIRSIREYFTRPYRNIIQNIDVTSVMTAYSNVNGDPVSYSSYFMDTLLRQAWGFSGYITSDCDSVSTITSQNYTNPHTGKLISTTEAFAMALAHGEDLECNNGFTMGNGSYATNMKAMLTESPVNDKGRFTENQVDISLHRLMTTRMRLGEFDGSIAYVTEAADRVSTEKALKDFGRQTAERVELAAEVAENAVVMLKNDDATLPLAISGDDAIDEGSSIVIIGPWAKGTYLGGYSSTQTTYSAINSNFVSIEQGIRNAYAGYLGDSGSIVCYDGFTDAAANLAGKNTIDEDAVTAAVAADITIVVLGNEQSDSNEEQDRKNLNFTGGQAQLAKQIGDARQTADKKTIVIMETFGPSNVEEFEPYVDAILWSGFAGIQKGTGFAKVLTGEKNPSGKTTALWHNKVDGAGSVVAGTTDIPPTTDYNMYYTDGAHPGRTYMYYKDAYKAGGVKYPFGYGLSYSTFVYSGISLTSTGSGDGDSYAADDTLKVSVDVANTSEADGEEVVQLYISQPNAPYGDNRPFRRLLGFEKVTIGADETKTVEFVLPVADVAYFDPESSKYAVDEGDYLIEIAGSSLDASKAEVDTNSIKFTVSDGKITPKPAEVTFKPNQAGDDAKQIAERLIFDRGARIFPNIAVAMNDESIYGRTIKDNVPPITQAPSITDIPLPDGMTVTYAHKSGDRAIDYDRGLLVAKSYGVETVEATVTYNGKTETGTFVVYVKSDPTPDNILVGGESLSGYEKGNTNYSVAVPYGVDTAPVVSYTPQANPLTVISYDAVQAAGIPGIAKVIARDMEVGGKSVEYNIGFARPPILSDFKTGAPELGAQWTVENPNTANVLHDSTGLQITSSSTAENIYKQPAAGNWEAEAHIKLSDVIPSRSALGLLGVEGGADDSLCLTIQNDVLMWPNEFGVPVPYPWPSMAVNREQDGVEAVVGSSMLWGGIPTDFYARVINDGGTYSFAYSTDKVNWIDIVSVDVTYLEPKFTLAARSGGDGAVASTDVTYEYLNFSGDNSPPEPPDTPEIEPAPEVVYSKSAFGPQVSVIHPWITSENIAAGTVKAYYTDDGTTPTTSSQEVMIMDLPYWGIISSIIPTGPSTIKVIVVLDGAQSSVGTGTVTPDAPTASKASGMYAPADLTGGISLSVVPGGAVLYSTGTVAYNSTTGTVDAEDIPEPATPYSAPIAITGATASTAFVIKAMTVYPAGTPTFYSEPVTFFYLSNNNLIKLTANNIDQVIAEMSLEERINLTGGLGMDPTILVNNGPAGGTYGIPRLGIPALVLADGPSGVRMRKNATVWMSPTGVASTWNTALTENLGARVAAEAEHYAVDIMLSPGLNTQRNPLGGRDFEYYSEDPLITGAIGSAYIKAVQANGVGVSMKHYAANDQENFRGQGNVVVSERALREIYLRGFEMAAEVKPWSYMGSYNAVNGINATAHKWLMTTLLRDEWGFDGFVMSDWGGDYDPPADLEAQMDLGEANRDAAAVWSWINDSTISQAEKNRRIGLVNRSVKNILGVIVKTNAFKGTYGTLLPDGTYSDLKQEDVNKRSDDFAKSTVYSASKPVAKSVSDEGMVLLKNENGVLPFAGNEKLALVTSQFAWDELNELGWYGNTASLGDFVTQGRGSAQVKFNEGDKYAPTLNEALKAAGFDVDWKIDGNIATDSAIAAKTAAAAAETAAASAAASADAGIFVLTRVTGEGADLTAEYFDLTEREKIVFGAYADAFHKAGKKMIVLINAGAAVNTTEFREKADAILEVWMPGTEGARSIADALKGAVNPSGKLTQTFPLTYADSSSIAMATDAHKGSTWGTNPVYYDEGVYVGYRYFNTFNTLDRVAYPFGYGLSYTTFAFSDLNVSKNIFNKNNPNDTIDVSVKVTNTGSRPGKEVVQLYLGASTYQTEKRPVSELKAFGKTQLLAPGASETVKMTLKLRDLQYYDDGNPNNILKEMIAADAYQGPDRWTVADGTVFTVTVGNTSDVRTLADQGLKGSFRYTTPSSYNGGVGGGSSSGASTAPAPSTAAPDVSAPVSTLPPALASFTDGAAVADWAQNFFARLITDGIISGRDDGRLDPKGNVTRAEFTKMIVLALKIEAGETPKVFNDDVKAGDWYKQFVDIASSRGLIQGISETSFAPNNVITRQDLCVIMYRALMNLNIPIPPADGSVFPDNDLVSDYAKDAVAALKQIGIVSGRSDGRFDPRTYATREETAKIVSGIMDYAAANTAAAPAAEAETTTPAGIAAEAEATTPAGITAGTETTTPAGVTAGN
ncbi:MAG: glycoside hydrolase family 3 C-terminal domain-containing protein [Clostridiales Family XIII bacterium]|jgi:beta-glucosidase|nr:glycoside hydrolase family 3 C-terminal domain-containing protein [Clostridiales Family XIII bacterium]